MIIVTPLLTKDSYSQSVKMMVWLFLHYWQQQISCLFCSSPKYEVLLKPGSGSFFLMLYIFINLSIKQKSTPQKQELLKQNYKDK